jgi:hypothetical protein
MAIADLQPTGSGHCASLYGYMVRYSLAVGRGIHVPPACYTASQDVYYTRKKERRQTYPLGIHGACGVPSIDRAFDVEGSRIEAAQNDGGLTSKAFWVIRVHSNALESPSMCVRTIQPSNEQTRIPEEEDPMRKVLGPMLVVVVSSKLAVGVAVMSMADIRFA